ncbi:MAG: VIT1/CCC1 transporter family protein, partial [Acidobacteriota bacterium]
MPQTPHIEHHFTAGPSVRDVVIGMADGLTVPFALAAGLSGVVAASRI